MEPHEFSIQLGELRAVITDDIAYFSAWQGKQSLMYDQKSSYLCQ